MDAQTFWYRVVMLSNLYLTNYNMPKLIKRVNCEVRLDVQTDAQTRVVPDIRLFSMYGQIPDF